MFSAYINHIIYYILERLKGEGRPRGVKLENHPNAILLQPYGTGGGDAIYS